MPRGYIDGPFGQIHYRDIGEGLPLLLLHQALMSQRQFDVVYDRLASRGIRAIGIDLPGSGQSDPADSVPTIEDFAEAAATLLDHLDLGQVHVLGHHTGAQVATELAISCPEVIASLIVNGPVLLNKQERVKGIKYVTEKEKDYEYRPDGSHLVELFEGRNQFRNEHTKLETATRYVAESFMGLGPMWHAHWAAFHYDHGAALAKLSCKTLILTNTGDTLYPQAQRTREMFPAYYYAEIEGGGIDIVDERPDLWAEIVASFVLGNANSAIIIPGMDAANSVARASFVPRPSHFPR